MNSKFGRGVIILMAGAIFLIFAPALSYGQTPSSEKKVVLTIAEALEKACQNNLDFRKASLTLDNARIAYKKARANVLQSE